RARRSRHHWQARARRRKDNEASIDSAWRRARIGAQMRPASLDGFVTRSGPGVIPRSVDREPRRIEVELGRIPERVQALLLGLGGLFIAARAERFDAERYRVRVLVE